MNVLLNILYLYLIVSALVFGFSVFAWLIQTYDYKESGAARYLRKARWHYRNVYTIGLLWLPLIVLAMFRAARITITGERT